MTGSASSILRRRIVRRRGRVRPATSATSPRTRAISQAPKSRAACRRLRRGIGRTACAARCRHRALDLKTGERRPAASVPRNARWRDWRMSSWLQHRWLTTNNAGCIAGIVLSNLCVTDLSMEWKRKVEMHPVLKRAKWIFIAFAVFISIVPPLQSRPWPRNAPNAADYLIINDNRCNGDIALVFWLASPLIPASAGQQAARDLLDKYVVIGVAHARVSKEATFTFDRATAPQVMGAKNERLQLLDTDTMSPAIVGALATVKVAFSQSLGEFGKGIQWFVFANGSVNLCSNGGMAVQFENEKYTYVTPVPGCPTT
jgi:hypothetical protein